MSKDARLSVLLVAALTVLAASAGAAAVTGGSDSVTDWPTYGADAANTGATDGTGPSAALNRTWRSNWGGSVDAAPVVAGDTVFAGDSDGNVAALASNGERRWVTQVDIGGAAPPIAASPAVTGDRVYVVAADGDSAHLVALDRSNGEQLWATQVGAGSDAAPVVGDGVVYVGSQPTSGNILNPQTGPLTAVNADGSVEWTATGLDGEVAGTPALVGDDVYAATVAGTVYRVDAASGNVEQSRTISDAAIRTAPTVSGDSVYVGTNASTVYRVDATTLAVQSSTNLNANPVLGSVAIDGDTVYAPASGGRIFALNATTLDHRNAESTDGRVYHAPSVVGDTVYVSTPGAVRTYGPGLDRRASFAPLGIVRSATVAADGQAYVGTDFGLVALAGDASAPGGGDDTPPDASLSVNESEVEPGQAVEFDASGSTDDGNIANYTWDFDGDGNVDETTRSDATVVHSYGSEGTYTASVTVTDEAGNSAEATATVTVNASGGSTDGTPTAALSANRTNVSTGESIEFDASNSSDNSSITEYRWDFDNDGSFEDTTTNDATVVHSYGSEGEYRATVNVTDDDGNTDEASVTITVTATDDNESGTNGPTAALSVSPSTASTGESVQFNASSSSDNGTIEKYEWDFNGDGTIDETTQSDPTVVYSYSTADTYEATVTVTDDDRNSDSAIVTVEVVNESNGNTNETDGPNESESDLGGGGGGGGGGAGGAGGDSTSDESQQNDTATPTSTPTPAGTPAGPVEGESHQASVRDGTVSFDDGDAPVEQIVFQQPTDGNVTVVELNRLPPNVPAPPGQMVAAMRIEVPADAESADATVRVPVSNAAFERAGVAPEDAQVYRWHDGAWQPLETRTVAEGDGRVVLAADTPGFSIFAVAEQEGTPTATPSPTRSGDDDTSPTDRSASESPSDEGAPLLFSGGGALGLLLLVALAVVLLGAMAVWRVRFDGNVLNPPGE